MIPTLAELKILERWWQNQADVHPVGEKGLALLRVVKNMLPVVDAAWRLRDACAKDPADPDAERSASGDLFIAIAGLQGYRPPDKIEPAQHG